MAPVNVITIVISILYITSTVSGCKALPEGGVNPSNQVLTATGGNSTLASETYNNSFKTTVNLSGHIGSLVIFSVIFLLIIAVYKRLGDYLTLVNDRLHNFAALFGIDGFAVRQPAIEADRQ